MTKKEYRDKWKKGNSNKAVNEIMGIKYHDPKIRKYFRDQVIKELRNIFGGNKKIHE